MNPSRAKQDRLYRQRNAGTPTVTGQRRKELRKWRAAGRPPGRGCDACGLPLDPEKGRRPNKPQYDHNHGTGEFRGWLCGHCNTALGLAGDNPRILRKLAEYLESRGYNHTRPLVT